MLFRSRVVLEGRLDEIKQRFSPNAIEVSPPLALDGWPGVLQVTQADGRQRVTLAPELAPRELLKQIVERGLPLDRFERATATLDEIFITVVKGDGDYAAR